MAKERQKEEMTESEARRKAIREQREKLDAENVRADQERQLQQSKANFGKRKDQLAARAADMIQKNGRDYFMSQTLLTFLDITIQMEDTIDMLTDINLAVSCITDAMSCMDDILQLNQMALQSSTQQNHGFFARRRAKKQMQKAIDNNLGRIKQICDMVTGSQELAYSITEGMQKANAKTQKRLAKSAAKRKKLEAKTPSGAPQAPSAGEQLVNKIISERGSAAGGGAPNGGGAPVSGGGAAPVTGGAPSSGSYDDIL